MRLQLSCENLACGVDSGRQPQRFPRTVKRWTAEANETISPDGVLTIRIRVLELRCPTCGQPAKRGTADLIAHDPGGAIA